MKMKTNWIHRPKGNREWKFQLVYFRICRCAVERYFGTTHCANSFFFFHFTNMIFMRNTEATESRAHFVWTECIFSDAICDDHRNMQHFFVRSEWVRVRIVFKSSFRIMYVLLHFERLPIIGSTIAFWIPMQILEIRIVRFKVQNGPKNARMYAIFFYMNENSNFVYDSQSHARVSCQTYEYKQWNSENLCCVDSYSFVWHFSTQV